MIIYKTPEQVELMRESNLMVSKTIALIASLIKPGITTMFLNTQAEQFIKDNGGIPSFKGYGEPPFPYTCCISVNDAVVHGFPNNNPIKDGDIISVDVGVYKNKFHGDSAYTFAVGQIAPEVQQLLKATKQSLYKGIEKARVGNRVGDISYAIQHYTEKERGYGVVRDLVGHGVGHNLHEEPQVPNYGKRGTGAKLKEGMTIAIEPMVNLGVKEVILDEDGWTIKTKDGKPAAHFEHSICITKTHADILSTFTFTEEAEIKNPNLFNSHL
jgi:methionyl aminopeptidase